MVRTRASSPRPAPPRATGASVPWMVFLSLIVCLAVAVGVQTSLGHPAGWLDQVAGRHDAVPTFASDAEPAADGRPVRIVPLAPDDPSAPPRAATPQEPSGTADGNAEAPSGTEAPAVEASPAPPAAAGAAAAEQTPAAPNARAPEPTPATRAVTRGAPLRVYVAGDSSAEG
ncbi:MAG: hypothetical protein ACRDJE_11100, partial [Dehalococcoidia bacterium]